MNKSEVTNQLSSLTHDHIQSSTIPTAYLSPVHHSKVLSRDEEIVEMSEISKFGVEVDISLRSSFSAVTQNPLTTSRAPVIPTSYPPQPTSPRSSSQSWRWNSRDFGSEQVWCWSRYRSQVPVLSCDAEIVFNSCICFIRPSEKDFDNMKIHLWNLWWLYIFIERYMLGNVYNV